MTLLFLSMMILGYNEAFVTGKVDEVFALAKKEQKYVVVDVYTTWCGPCKLMDKHTFAAPEVKAFLKDKVVAYKIDAEKGEGVAFARKYRVMGYPCVLVLDADGKLVDKSMGYLPAKYFLDFVTKAVQKTAS